jgi:hypothetical protein
MSVSMYQASVPPLSRGLKILSTILQKVAAHPDAQSLVYARLAPDMMTLAGPACERHLQRVRGAARRHRPAQLCRHREKPGRPAGAHRQDHRLPQQREAGAFEGSEVRTITFKGGMHTFNFTGQSCSSSCCRTSIFT